MNQIVPIKSAPPKKKLLEVMADRYGLEAKIFKQTVEEMAMPRDKQGRLTHTDAELISCLLVANEHDMNPLTREIFFMRQKGFGPIVPIVSVDGWLKKLNAHPQFDGMEFEDKSDDQGKPISCTAKIYRKDRSHPTVVTEYFSECQQPMRNGKPGAWQSHPWRMMRHRVLTQAARYAVGFAGVMDLDEFQQWQANDVIEGSTTVSHVAGAGAAATAVDALDDIPDPDVVEQDQAADAVELVGGAPPDVDLFGDIPDPDGGHEEHFDEESFIDLLSEHIVTIDAPEILEELRDANQHMIDKCSAKGAEEIAELFQRAADQLAAVEAAQ
jgi:hypothetical protein